MVIVDIEDVWSVSKEEDDKGFVSFVAKAKIVDNVTVNVVVIFVSVNLTNKDFKNKGRLMVRDVFLKVCKDVVNLNVEATF